MQHYRSLADKNIVLAKLAPPELPPCHVPRTHLYERFLSCLSWKIIVVAAPVGYGKTALISEWYHTYEAENPWCCAWLSLDDEDKDPIRLSLHLVAALGSIWSDIDEIEWLPEADDERKAFTIRLSNFLHRKAKGDRRYILFLDNIDQLPASHASCIMGMVGEYFPANVNVVVAGSAFATTVVDFKLWDMIYDFPPAELNFSKDEVRAFSKNLFGTAISPHLTEQLYDLTQGWVAGVKLYADSIEYRSAERSADFDSRALYPYIDRFFSSCVFDKIPEDMATFLLETSIVDRLCAPLCDTITNRKDSQAVIDRLVKRSFFIETCDLEGVWYRYHPLFLKWLRSKLLQFQANQIRELAYRASEWFERHDKINEAAKYMLMASDSDLVENLAASANFKRDDDSEQFLAWICNIPARSFPGDPTLNLLTTWGYVCFGRAHDALAWLSVFMKNLESAKQTEANIGEDQIRAAAITAKHVTIKCREFDGYYAEAIQEYKELLEEQENMSLSLRCIVVHALAESYERIGEFNLAQEHYLQTEAIAELANSLFFVSFSRYARAWIQAMRGELEQAQATCHRALRDCPTDFTLYGALYSVLAYTQVERNQLDEASTSMKRAYKRLSSNRNPDMLFEANIVKACLIASCGNLDEAYRLIVQTVLLAERRTLPRDVLLFAYTIQARIAIIRGNMLDAVSVHKKLLKRVAPSDRLYGLRTQLIEARISASEGDSAAALGLADAIITEARSAGLGPIVVEALVLETSILAESGRKTQALAQLGEAITIASTQSAIRPFLQESDLIRALLHELVNIRKTSSTVRSFARKVLAAFAEKNGHSNPVEHSGSHHVGFTKREADVLALLNAGMSRIEIAETLGVSHNTVKTHINNIYTKLGVDNRIDAFKATVSNS